MDFDVWSYFQLIKSNSTQMSLIDFGKYFNYYWNSGNEYHCVIDVCIY